MRFTIMGFEHEIEREDVLKVADDSPPGPVGSRHKFFVRLKDRRYPIKQLLAGATGLSNSEFTAQYAQRMLRKLGFVVEEFGPTRPKAHFGPDSSSSRDEVTPEEGQDAMQFAVTLERDEDGFYVSSCPALQGCHSQGRTRGESLSNIAQAIRGYLASMEKHGETLPNERWEVVEVVL